MAIETVTTENSTYQVDWVQGAIRRMRGAYSPTPWQGKDGLWQAATITRRGDDRMFIEWADRPGATLTSPILLTSEVDA